MFDFLFCQEEQVNNDLEEQVIGNDDKFSLFDSSIEHDTVIQAGGIVEATISYAASSLVVQGQPHYKIWEIDEGDEMEIDDDQKEENWQNPKTFAFEKYMKGFTQIKPKFEDKEDTEDMIVESNPIKRAEALLKKAFHTVKFASPTNNQVYLEADGETEKTPEFWDKISDGAMCALFPADNWHGSINKGEYHPHDYGIKGLPDNLAGGICEHGLIPLRTVQNEKFRWTCKGIWMDGRSSWS